MFLQWTANEIDLVVADYFEMLSMELALKPFVKSSRNEALQKLTGRSRGSIEFKHQNISAVLFELGLPWISGYKPMGNYQHALLEAIERFLLRQYEVLSSPISEQRTDLAEPDELYYEAPLSFLLSANQSMRNSKGSLENLIQQSETKKTEHSARKAKSRSFIQNARASHATILT